MSTPHTSGNAEQPKQGAPSATPLSPAAPLPLTSLSPNPTSPSETPNTQEAARRELEEMNARIAELEKATYNSQAAARIYAALNKELKAYYRALRAQYDLEREELAATCSELCLVEIEVEAKRALLDAARLKDEFSAK
ncbi:hypothetical protein BOTBODRAFT_375751 [Botryobasidium botryosum FD-172 SS1]|uniref:Uncharacterized protein n=1 Tax=Botryobasidium botryosum (strain FD-172 SS1) TaxID=930990 RepID=A0A067N7J8_BOTB1|nr:hypothetical protein BOTBODRAFT_375751 [Botryobasidium botryosum FD-172 SS1]